MNEEKKLTYGEKAVGLLFNPSNDDRVYLIKKHFADVIDEILNAKDSEMEMNGEKARLYYTAITEAQTAQMWAVKAITWRG